MAFGQELFDVRTSAGVYWVSYWYEGKNQGQSRTNWFLAGPETGGGCTISVPNKIHWECLNYILSMLTPTKGDTFVVGIKKPGSFTSFSFVCEFTSATQYNYWFVEHPPSFY
jgi:hypothetical protein